jgi:hypothetical protein
MRSHGAYLSGEACPHAMVVAFLANPLTAPNASYFAQVTGPQWATAPIKK